MNITIRAQGFEVSSAIKAVVQEETRAALKRFADEIISVDVFMKDTNGPRGGIDKQVLVRVRMRGRQQITLQTTHEDLYAAIRVSSKRAKRAVRRNLCKARRFDKLSLRRLAADPSGEQGPER